jgi:hypothetical protein
VETAYGGGGGSGGGGVGQKGLNLARSGSGRQEYVVVAVKMDETTPVAARLWRQKR